MTGIGITGDLALETAFFGQALLTGAALGVYYDLYRILRRLFRFGYAMIIGQDILFWLTGAVGVFFASAVATGGQLRIVFVLAAMAGWGIYAATIGSLLMKVADMVTGLLRKLLSVVNKKTVKPICLQVGRAIRCADGCLREKFSRIMRKKREKREKTS